MPANPHQRPSSTTVGRAGAAALLLAGALALLAEPALAHPPRSVVGCGDTLTHSVRLANDLRDCDGDGLVIGAAGITVDLGGHTIDGTIPLTGDCGENRLNDAGIQNDAGYDDVTITNGTVQQFSKGIAAGGEATGMSDGRLRGLAVRDNRLVGIVIVGTQAAGAGANTGNRLERNVVSGTVCGSAMFVGTARANRIVANRVSGNLDGIVVCCGAATDGNTITANSVTGGFTGVAMYESGRNVVTDNAIADADEGIIVVGSASENRIENNAIARTQAGIVLDVIESDAPTGNRVAGNTLRSIADGIIVFQAQHTEVTSNQVTGAGTFGDPEAAGFGIVLESAGHSVVDRNSVTGSRGPAISVGATEGESPSPTDNVVSRNSVNRNSTDGIRVIGAARNTTIERNTTDRNGADGIHVLSRSTTITRNTASHNALYGIEALPGVTDGGGNRAHGNGNRPQCIGVACNQDS